MASAIRVFLLLSILCIWGCHKEPPLSEHDAGSHPIPGGVLRIAAQAPESLDPIQSKNYWESEIVLQVFDGLLKFDQNLNIAPALAQNWQVSSDGRTYTFNLRKGAYFHHGRKVTAEDFVFSLTRLLDPRWKSPDAEHYVRILGATDYRSGKAPRVAGLEALDDYTVQIKLERTYAPFLCVLAQQPASVVPREAIEKDGSQFGRSPVGTGAYRLHSWKPNGEIFLTANPDYFDGPPHLDGVRIKTFSALSAHQTFQDFLDQNLDISFVPSQQVQLAQSEKDWVYVSRPILRFMYLGINLKDRLMRDLHVRRAIHLAINKSKVVGDEPDYSIMHNLIPFSLLGYNPAANHDVYNFEEAKKALRLSRFYREAPLKVSLWHATPSESRAQLLGRLTDDLKAVGIEVDVKIVPSLNDLTKKIYSGETQLFLIGEVIDFPDPDALLNRLFNSKSEGNPFGYENTEVDRMLREAQTMLNENVRAQLYREIENQILGDHVIIPLFVVKYSFVTHRRVRGLELNPLGFQYLPLRNVWLQN